MSLLLLGAAVGTTIELFAEGEMSLSNHRVKQAHRAGFDELDDA